MMQKSHLISFLFLTVLAYVVVSSAVPTLGNEKLSPYSTYIHIFGSICIAASNVYAFRKVIVSVISKGTNIK